MWELGFIAGDGLDLGSDEEHGSHPLSTRSFMPRHFTPAVDKGPPMHILAWRDVLIVPVSEPLDNLWHYFDPM